MKKERPGWRRELDGVSHDKAPVDYQHSAHREERFDLESCLFRPVEILFTQRNGCDRSASTSGGLH